MRNNQIILFILVTVFVIARAWWHPYDKSKRIPAYCTSANASHVDKDGTVSIEDKYFKRKPLHRFPSLSEADIKKYKLWPGLISTFDRTHGETIAGFSEAMETIWRNQHPPDCSKAKYLIADGNNIVT